MEIYIFYIKYIFFKFFCCLVSGGEAVKFRRGFVWQLYRELFVQDERSFCTVLNFLGIIYFEGLLRYLGVLYYDFYIL